MLGEGHRVPKPPSTVSLDRMAKHDQLEKCMAQLDASILEVALAQLIYRAPDLQAYYLQ